MSTTPTYPPFSGYSGTGGGGGGGAPTNATYLTLTVDATLTDERVFTLAPRLSGVDAGPGNTYTVDLAVIGGLLPGAYTNTSLTVDAYGRITSASSGPAPVLSVSVDAGELTDTGTPTAPVLGLATAGTAGTYAYPASMTTDAFGRVTAVTAGVAPVASGWTDGGTVVYLTTPSDDVSIGNNVPVTNRKVSVYNTGTDLGMSVVTLASADNVLETFVSGEANVRWAVDGTGATRWGAGGASAPDTRLVRSSAGTLALDNNAGGAGSLLPATDSLGNIGGGANRWNGVIANGFLVYATAGAANASTTMGNQAIRMGAGGGSALDLKLSRTAASTLTIDNNVGGGASIVPAADSTGTFGTSNLRWLDNIANTHRVFPSAGAANASASLASGALKLGAGGATALDTQIVRNAAKTLQVDDNGGGAATFSVIGTTRTQTRAVATTTQVGAYVVAAGDDVVLVNPNAGAFDVTLPNANVLTGRRIQVKRITTSANAVTVKSAGGTIDNVAAATGIALAGGTLNAITVVSDGTNWWIV